MTTLTLARLADQGNFWRTVVVSVLTDTAPKRIWLCVSDDEDDYDLPYPELYAEDAEITWSTDQPVAVTVEYVRADVSEFELFTVAAERDALAELLREVRDWRSPDDPPYTLHRRIDAALAKDKT